MENQEEKNEGYAICFNQWLFDNRIKNDLQILLLISSLSASEGYCFASNSYFSEKFKIDEATVSRKIKKLEKLGYITITYIKRGCEVERREIRLTNLSSDCSKCQPSIDENINRTIDENVKDNNTSINNTNNNNIYPDKKCRAKFIPPTKEEIKEYCWLKRYDNVDVNHFYDYYEALDWHYRDGKKMVSWKQAIVTWAHNNYQNSGNNKPKIGIDGIPISGNRGGLF